MVRYMGYHLAINNPDRQEVLAKLQLISVEEAVNRLPEREQGLIKVMITSILDSKTKHDQMFFKDGLPDPLAILCELTHRLGVQTTWRNTPRWALYAEFNLMETEPFRYVPLGKYYPYALLYEDDRGIYRIENYLELFKYIYPRTKAAQHTNSWEQRTHSVQETFSKLIHEHRAIAEELEHIGMWQPIRQIIVDTMEHTKYTQYDMTYVVHDIIPKLANLYMLKTKFTRDSWQFFKTLYDVNDPYGYEYAFEVIATYWPTGKVMKSKDEWFGIDHWLELPLILYKIAKVVRMKPNTYVEIHSIPNYYDTNEE